MPYTLIVVDLQREFSAACKRSLIDNCKELIFSAIDDCADIVYLEYVGFGRTNFSLTKLTDSYHSAYYVRKSDCSGARQIKEVKDVYKLQTQHFKVCGVNTDQCVQETVIELSELFFDSVIEVVARACNSNTKNSHKLGLEAMGWYDNVVINND